MILIADSGSTKTEWRLLDERSGRQSESFFTKGLNPYFVTPEAMVRELSEALLPKLGGASVSRVWFYGAGAREEKHPMIRAAVRELFDAEVFVATDMLGAARALFGASSGIACILGTGANSCLYDGSGIVSNVPPLGYLLGDEGSGAWIGKRFLADLLKGLLSRRVSEAFRESYPDETPEVILSKVYGGPNPNRYLASFAPFVGAAAKSDPAVQNILKEGFDAFLRRNLLLYPEARERTTGFSGSIAFHFREILAEAAAGCGLRAGRILKSPMEGLAEYHTLHG